MPTPTHQRLAPALERFTAWLDGHGEVSHDHQSFFAGRSGGAAKRLYYRHRVLGVAAVAPLIFCEAFVPSARRLFGPQRRFPIADAHYAMGYAALHRLTGEAGHLQRAVHFLEVLLQTRSPGFERHGWGYPFDWVTRTGVMTAGTPLITTTPYVFEAFAAVHAIAPEDRWQAVMRSIAEHAFVDIHDHVLGEDEASAGYNPQDLQGGVVNASAYRAGLLMSAAQRFERADYRRAAEHNLNFVLRQQQADGSWHYAADGVRSFVDHFHTCFVLKALAKIEALVGPGFCTEAIDRGLRFYTQHLFDAQGLPKPFATAPRMTVYRHELYDYAECLNLGVLLRGRSEALDQRFERTLEDLTGRWQKPDGSFRSRRLLLGWDDVPMHRWAQSQAFRSLALAALCLEKEGRAAPPCDPVLPPANPATVRADALSTVP